MKWWRILKENPKKHIWSKAVAQTIRATEGVHIC